MCWANHSWYAKTWDPKVPDKLLIQQTYPGEQDYIDHFYAMLPAFKDKRYMRVDGKLLFGLFAPLDIPEPNVFFNIWNKLAKENGLNEFYFFGFTFNHLEVNEILKIGYNSAVIDNVRSCDTSSKLFNNFFTRLKRKLFKIPKLIQYDNYVKYMKDNYYLASNIHPCINPNFDHSPRSAHRGVILINNTPQKWYNLCRDIFEMVNKRKQEENLVFIKAWNEWGEGNYLEPDLKFGRQYLDETRKAWENFN